MSNPYEPPAETTVPEAESGPPSPFFGLPVSLACFALGLLVSGIFWSVVISAEPMPRRLMVIAVSVALSFLCLGGGSLIRSRMLFTAGWCFMVVWIVSLVQAFVYG